MRSTHCAGTRAERRFSARCSVRIALVNVRLVVERERLLEQLRKFESELEKREHSSTRSARRSRSCRASARQGERNDAPARLRAPDLVGQRFDSPLPAHILPRFRAGPSASIEAFGPEGGDSENAGRARQGRGVVRERDEALQETVRESWHPER